MPDTTDLSVIDTDSGDGSDVPLWAEVETEGGIPYTSDDGPPMDTYHIPSGNELRVYRDALGVSQRWVAQVTGLHHTTVRKAETDPTSVRVSSLLKVLQALRVAYVEYDDESFVRSGRYSVRGDTDTE
jgi:DNA-binding XRE family transcriptional regulator